MCLHEAYLHIPNMHPHTCDLAQCKVGCRAFVNVHDMRLLMGRHCKYDAFGCVRACMCLWLCIPGECLVAMRV